MTELDKLPANSLAFRDYTNQQSVDVAPEELVAQVAEATGRPYDDLYDEILEGREWAGQITMLEYVTYRLYTIGETQRKEFISDWLHWPIHACCEDPDLSPRTVDKWQCTNILTQAGIPTIPNVAMIDSNNAITVIHGQFPTASS